VNVPKLQPVAYRQVPVVVGIFTKRHSENAIHHQS